VIQQFLQQLGPVQGWDLGSETLQFLADIGGVDPVEFADDRIFVAEELVERADRHPSTQGDLIGGEGFEADLHQECSCCPQDLIESSPASLLRRPSPGQEFRDFSLTHG